MKLLEDSGICPTIAINCGLISSLESYSDERNSFQIKVRGLKGRDLYFSKKIAKELDENYDGDSSGKDPNRPLEFQQLPKQGPEFAELRKPYGFQFVPMIPVRMDGKIIQPKERIRLPMKGTVYFDIVQGACDFSSSGRTIRQINLAPTPVAVDLYSNKNQIKTKHDSYDPADAVLSPAMRAKRRRLS